MGGEEEGQDKSIVVMLQRLQAAKGQVRKLEEALRQKGVDVGDDDDVGGREASPSVNEEAVRRQLLQFAQVAKAEAKGRRKTGEEEGETVGSFEESFWDPKEVMRDLGAKPVGHIRTCFPKKNGCPRQGSVCPNSVALLDLTFGNNPHHGADGLADYSHVWLIFLFDLNGTDYTPRPRVMPPRLRGKTMGVFATRSPHRPNPIGLSLVRLDAVHGRRLTLSGVDLVDGTPILDVKPYIPSYDAPVCVSSGMQISGQTRCECGSGTCFTCPEWATPTPETSVRVEFSRRALDDMEAMKAGGLALRVLRGWDDVRGAIEQVVQADPRSTYRKDKCAGEEYAFYIDHLDVGVKFCDDSKSATVTCIKHMTGNKGLHGGKPLLPSAGGRGGVAPGGVDDAAGQWSARWQEGVEGAREASVRLLGQGF